VLDNLDETLAALADPTRRRVIDLLRDGPKRAGELASTARMSAPAMSRHLRVLRDTGLVQAEGNHDDARLRVYRLRPERFVALQAWLDQVQAFWREQLDAFKGHTDRRRSS
jgi:DNA-binding transcriptional ArsR family regulator